MPVVAASIRVGVRITRRNRQHLNGWNTVPNLLKRKSSDENVWGNSGKAAENDRKLVMHLAQKMAGR